MVAPRQEPSGTTAASTGPVTRWRDLAVWCAIFLALAAWAVYRLDIFPLSASVPLNGAGSIPRAFYTVDHPFHTARAELIRSAWASFDTVRWVANHQGGYPAEFYPFGVAGTTAFVSFLSLGQLSIESAWAITIAAFFLLPGAAYLLIGRVDRLSPAVAAAALAGQIAIASDWTHGGFTELVEWGLATNVAGFTWALVALPVMVAATARRSSALVAAAAVAIALCAVSNPRSLIAVAVIGLAILIDAVARRQFKLPFLSLLGIAALAAGLAAPLLVPLVRYRDLYFFLSYQEYADLGAYWSATVGALSWPVAILAVVGAALAMIRPGHRAARIATISLGLYIALTAVAVLSPSIRDLIPQLELPRLMPFQRLLVIWLAAYGTVELVRMVARVPAMFSQARDWAVAIAASLVLIVVFATGVGPYAAAEQGLRPVPKTEGADAVELVQFEDAVALADREAGQGTAILVIGSHLSWHEQLWAPLIAPQRSFYYNDWLWYWHHLQEGPFDYRQGHFYPDPSLALDRDYLDAHGIGAVVITDIADRSTGVDARQVAAESPELDRAGTIGAWDVYAVRDPLGLATLNGEAADAVSVSDDGETIRLTFNDAEPGTVTVRENWFPRWKWSRLDQSSLPETPRRAEDGYMEFDTGGGDIQIELRYGETTADAIARLASMASALIVVVMLLAATPIPRWGHR
jgi:hypothetical protein